MQKLINQQVDHRAFGTGTICSCDEGTVTVRFDCGEKKFAFPDAFESFLSVKEASCKKTIEAALRQKREQSELEKAKWEENLEATRVKIAEEKAAKNASRRRTTARTKTPASAKKS